MNWLYTVTILAYILNVPCTWAEEPTQSSESSSSQRDWHIFANISYTTRTLSGSVQNRNVIADNLFGNLYATGDSMNLDTSDSFMYTVAAQYKRWRIGLNYAPTSFSGQGYALVDLTGSMSGVLTQTPLHTDIAVDLLLGKLSYDIIQTPGTRFGVGVGLGSSYVDLSIIPQVGDPIIYNGNQPFGFLSLYMANNYHGFLYGFNFNAISATFTGVEVDYSDYTVELGYRLSDKAIKWDVVGGYRLVNFSIDIEDSSELIKADTKLQGPFIGLSMTY